MHTIFMSVLYLCIALVASAQTRVVGISLSHVAPVGEVPSYVKEKVNLPSEVYAKLEALNREKKVDYSVLFKKTFPFRQELFAAEVERYYKDLKANKLEENPIIFSASSFGVNDSLSWKQELRYSIDENLQFGKQSAVVCVPSDAAGQAQIMLEVWYLYDKSKHEVNVVKKQLSSAGMCHIDLSGIESVYIYDSVVEPVGFLYIEYGCNYSYTDESGKTVSRTLFSVGNMQVDK